MNILLPHRFIEAERSGNARDLCLIGLRIDQYIHRVSDGKHAHEHQRRHHKQREQALG